MRTKYFTLIIFILSSFTSFSDRRMSVENIESGEAFEVTVPDGLKITHYNSNWLDSVPYLIEHARWHEPWAYNALAECYSYGKGGD